MRTRLGSICLTVYLVVACSSPKWHLSVYPTGNHLDAVRDLGEYPTLDKCRQAAAQYLTDVGASDRGNYECGKNCRKSGAVGDITLYTCDETLR
jgi:hypothetical protein